MLKIPITSAKLLLGVPCSCVSHLSWPDSDACDFQLEMPGAMHTAKRVLRSRVCHRANLLAVHEASAETFSAYQDAYGKPRQPYLQHHMESGTRLPSERTAWDSQETSGNTMVCEHIVSCKLQTL